jgi:xanthine dehydrogenase molybdopterin-binding subunit B
MKMLLLCATGVQEYETDEAQWPISQPVEKIEARVQCAGEAEYVEDIPLASGELHAAFVMTSQANCDIVSVDTAAALVDINSFPISTHPPPRRLKNT